MLWETSTEGAPAFMPALNGRKSFSSSCFSDLLSIDIPLCVSAELPYPGKCFRQHPILSSRHAFVTAAAYWEVICAFFGNSTRDKMYKDINRLLINAYTTHKYELQKGILNIRYPSVKDIMDQEIEKECNLTK